MKNLNLLTYNLFSIHLLEEVKDSYIIEIIFYHSDVKCVGFTKFCSMGLLIVLKFIKYNHDFKSAKFPFILYIVHAMK